MKPSLIISQLLIGITIHLRNDVTAEKWLNLSISSSLINNNLMKESRFLKRNHERKKRNQEKSLSKDVLGTTDALMGETVASFQAQSLKKEKSPRAPNIGPDSKSSKTKSKKGYYPTVSPYPSASPFPTCDSIDCGSTKSRKNSTGQGTKIKKDRSNSIKVSKEDYPTLSPYPSASPFPTCTSIDCGYTKSEKSIKGRKKRTKNDDPINAKSSKEISQENPTVSPYPSASPFPTCTSIDCGYTKSEKNIKGRKKRTKNDDPFNSKSSKETSQYYPTGSPYPSSSPFPTCTSIDCGYTKSNKGNKSKKTRTIINDDALYAKSSKFQDYPTLSPYPSASPFPTCTSIDCGYSKSSKGNRTKSSKAPNNLSKMPKLQKGVRNGKRRKRKKNQKV